MTMTRKKTHCEYYFTFRKMFLTYKYIQDYQLKTYILLTLTLRNTGADN